MNTHTVNNKQGILCSSFLMKLCTFLVLCLFAPKVFAQLDYIHYVPPLYNGSSNGGDIGKHVAVITTNSDTPIDVDIFKGTDPNPITIQVSKSVPGRYLFKTINDKNKGTISNPTSYDFPFGVVGPNELNQKLPSAGLKIRSYDAPIYVNIRHVSDVQGGSLTTKGRFAKGKEFRSGHVYNDEATKSPERRSHFISVMATDSTAVVKFTDIKSDILTAYKTSEYLKDFIRSGNRVPIEPTDIIEVTLQKGESFVIGVDHNLSGFDGTNMNEMNGTHIVSDKDIVVNTGSWTAGAGDGQDMGIDQIVPYDQIRDQYVVMKGKGNNTTERPIVVATENDTYIYVNEPDSEAGTPINFGKPLSAGESFVIPKSYYQDPDGKGIPTMFIDTRGKNVYVYQTMSGSGSRGKIGPTVGMNFIAPLASTGMHQVDVPYSGQLATEGVTSVITILAQTDATSWIDYSIDGGDFIPLNKNEATSIPGKLDWKSYKVNNVNGHLQFRSDKAINVAWTVQSGYIGAAGYYSGFSKAIPKIITDLDVSFDTGLEVICESYNENIVVGIEATPEPDFVEWYENEIIEANLIPTETKGTLIVPAPDVATKYIVKAYFRDPALNFNTNANIDAGQVIFDTDFKFSEKLVHEPGTYDINNLVKNSNTKFASSVNDVGRGKMLIVYSDGMGKTIYEKKIPVERKTNHIISVVGRKLIEDKPQLVDIYINDEKVKSNFLINDIVNWESVSALWKSKDNQNATIKLVDANPAGVAGAFAIDTVAFATAAEEEGEFNALVIPTYSYTSYGEPQHFCKGQFNETIDISNGDVSWYTYLWEKKSGENFVAINDETITGTESYVLGFSKVNDDHAGLYRCTINFKEQFQRCGEASKPVSLDVEVVVDEPATLTLVEGEADICEGVSTTLRAEVGGAHSSVTWFVDNEEKHVGKIFDFNLDEAYSAGVYTIRCDVANGCTPLSEETSIKIYARPELNDLIIPTDLCDQVAKDLTAVVDIVPDGATLDYSWYHGDDFVVTNNLSTHTIIPDLDDTHFKVAVAARYNIGPAKELTCSGNELVENLATDAVYPKVILTDLTDISLCEGETHTFYAEVSPSSNTYKYNWEIPFVLEDEKKKGSDFVLEAVTPALGGTYEVTVFNRCGSAVSSSELSVTPKLLVTDISIDKNGPYCLNDPVQISITDNGQAKLYKAENLTSGHIENPMSNPFNLIVNDANKGRWKITAEGFCENEFTSEFTFDYVKDFSEPELDPITTCYGEDVSFDVKIETIPTGSVLTYTWTVPVGSSVVDSGTRTLDILDVQAADLGDYTCEVRNQCGCIKTVTAKLSADKVNGDQTAQVVVCENESVDFIIDYDGDPTFAWTFTNAAGTIIDKALGTDDNHHIDVVTLDDAGVYYCDITLACGTTVKYQRQLIVNNDIAVVEDPTLKLDICEGAGTELGFTTSGTVRKIQWFDKFDVELPDYFGKKRISTGEIDLPGTYTYKYKVTGDCGVIDGSFDVVVHTKPSIDPIDPITACEGKVNLNMFVTSIDPATSEWWDADGNTLEVGLSHTLSEMLYSGNTINYIAATNTAICKDSVKATVQVYIHKPIKVVSKSTLTPTPCLGEPLSLVVNGEGDGLSYKWTKGGVDQGVQPIPNILDLDAADLGDNGNYRCELISGKGCGEEVNVDFKVVVREHASIITQPVPLTPCEGDGSVTFTVEGTAVDSPYYQWYDNDGKITNGGDFSGATTTDLIVSNLKDNDKQSFYCEVSGDYCDPVESEKASLTVKRNVKIKDPVDITIAENGVATFIVEAEGTEPFIYKWFADGVSVGGNSPTLTIDPAVIGLDGKKYNCLVSNDCLIDIASAEAILTVDPAIKITTQPVNTEICVDGTFEFVVYYKKSATTCTWQYDDGGGTFISVPGSVGSQIETVFDASLNKCTLTIDDATDAMNSWKFRAKVTAPDNISNEVSVKVFTPAAFDNIDPVEICKDAGASFSVTGLTGTAPFTYVWKDKDDTNIGSNSSLNLNAAKATDGAYSVSVTAGVCPAETKIFNITHFDDLSIKGITVIDPICQNRAEDIEVSINLDLAFNSTVSYTWSKDGGALAGTTDEVKYNIKALDKSESGLYKVDVTDGCGTISATRFVNVLNEITKPSSWNNQTICLGKELLLEAKVEGDNPTYTWTVPAGSTNPGNVALFKLDAISIANAGTYTCEISGPCGTAVTYTANITVNKVPNITAGLEGLSDVCVGESLVLGTIVYDATTGESIQWTLPDGSTSAVILDNLDLGTADLSEEGNYRVEVTNACGTDFSLGYQDVNPIPKMAPIDDQDACQGEDVIFRAVATGENLNYSWYVDGVLFDNEAELLIPNVLVLAGNENKPKTYDIECRVNACGPELTRTAKLTVNPNTILKSAIKTEVKYVGKSHTISLNVTGSNLNYEWHHTKTDGTDVPLSEETSILQLDDLTTDHAGDYTCTITGDCGTRFTSGLLTVKDPLKIVSGFISNNIEKCFGEPLNLNVSVSGEVYSIEWSKDGVDLAHDKLNYFISELDTDDAGSYTCKILGEGGEFIETAFVTVNQQTVLKSHLKDEILCENENLSWIPNVSGTNLSFIWKHNGKIVSEVAELEILNTPMDSAGIYSVDISDKCGKVVSTEANLEILKLPVYKSHSHEPVVCENTDEVIFSVTYEGDNLLYQWQKDGVNINDANSSVYKIQNLRTTDAGIYKCIVTSTCDLILTSPEMEFVVNPQLKILSESGNLEVCEEAEATFIVEVEGNEVFYQWKFNGDNIPDANAQAYTIPSSSLSNEGLYTCELSDKCTSKRYSNSKRLEVNALPNSQIFGRTKLCVLEDRVAYNTALQPDINYGWLVNGGEFAGPEIGSRTKITWGEIPEDGNIKLKITNEDTGCYFEIDSAITLHPLPDVSLLAMESRGVCESEFELKGGFPEGGIYWVNGVAQNFFDPSQGNGNYSVRYSYTDEIGCSNSTGENTLKIDSLPIVKLIEDVVVGSCKTQKLWAETDEDNIRWSPSRYLDDPNSKTPIFSAEESTLYVATVVDKYGCVGNDIVDVTVAPLPLITTINDTVIGECKVIELTTHISGDISEIIWTNEDHLSNSTISNPKLTNAPVGVNNYNINVTDEYGCVASESLQVEVKPNPEVGDNQFLCEGETYMVDTRDLSNPIWSDGYTAWERVIDKPGEYELRVDEFDCEVKQTIVMHPTPEMHLRDTILFEGQTIRLDPGLDLDYGPYAYKWSDGSVSPDLEVGESNTYKLDVEDNIGCIASDSAVVVVKPVGIESPNAFSPLSGNENNRFYLKEINVIESFEMYIYNRWGELMYKTNEPGYANGWDGTYNGEDCPVGAYVWVLMLNGELKEKGNVILVR